MATPLPENLCGVCGKERPERNAAGWYGLEEGGRSHLACSEEHWDQLCKRVPALKGWAIGTGDALQPGADADRWWATYNAALTGLLSVPDTYTPPDAHDVAAEAAFVAHGPLSTEVTPEADPCHRCRTLPERGELCEEPHLCCPSCYDGSDDGGTRNETAATVEDWNEMQAELGGTVAIDLAELRLGVARLGKALSGWRRIALGGGDHVKAGIYYHIHALLLSLMNPKATDEEAP